MGRAFFEETDAGREVFAHADAILGFPLSRLCFVGPEEDLTRTENAQPALFTVSAIAWRLLEARGVHPVALAGHSLGEYSALAAAGAITFEDGLRAVRRRGELMAAVGDRVQGGMAAVLGLSSEEVAGICEEVSRHGVVEIANYNTPQQAVISGERKAVDLAMALAKDRGAKRVLPLKVAAPFHSSLMAPLAEEMGEVLRSIEVREPRVPVIANVTAGYVRTPDEIREALTRQVAGSVRWTETVQRLAADGIELTVEAGPGRVLTAMTPRIASGMRALDTAEALAAEW